MIEIILSYADLPTLIKLQCVCKDVYDRVLPYLKIQSDLDYFALLKSIGTVDSCQIRINIEPVIRDPFVEEVELSMYKFFVCKNRKKIINSWLYQYDTNRFIKFSLYVVDHSIGKLCLNIYWTDGLPDPSYIIQRLREHMDQTVFRIVEYFVTGITFTSDKYVSAKKFPKKSPFKSKGYQKDDWRSNNIIYNSTQLWSDTNQSLLIRKLSYIDVHQLKRSMYVTGVFAAGSTETPSDNIYRQIIWDISQKYDFLNQKCLFYYNKSHIAAVSLEALVDALKIIYYTKAEKLRLKKLNIQTA